MTSKTKQEIINIEVNKQVWIIYVKYMYKIIVSTARRLTDKTNKRRTATWLRYNII